MVSVLNNDVINPLKPMLLDTARTLFRGVFVVGCVSLTLSNRPNRGGMADRANETTGVIDKGQPDADRSASKAGITDKRAFVALTGGVAPLLDNSVVKLNSYSSFEAIANDKNLPRLHRVAYCP
jgi:hypothetical protein